MRSISVIIVMLLSEAIKIFERKMLEDSEISVACNYQSVTWSLNYHQVIKFKLGSFQIIC